MIAMIGFCLLKLEFTPLEFETYNTPPFQGLIGRLEFTPLEFETCVFEKSPLVKL